MTELAKEVIKDWRRPAAVLLRLAILFRTFGPQRSDILPKHIEVEKSIDIPHTTPKVLSLPTDLEAVSP